MELKKIKLLSNHSKLTENNIKLVQNSYYNVVGLL